MKKITLELPETKKEFINCLKKLDTNLVNQENDTHYLVPCNDLIENVVYIKKYNLIIKIYEKGKACVLEETGNNLWVIKNDTKYKYAYLAILEYINKI